MDTKQELITWFKQMGYDGEIPESLGNICNSSTAFIWNQLMQNAKPQQEVDNLRNNIIIHRLRSRPLHKQDEFSYPLKEIDLFIKKQTLENKLNNLKSIINEKKHKLNNLCQNNKMKYVAIEKLKSKVKENEQREYLLGKKCKMLESNIQEAEETLKCAKNLTPVELDENPNTKDITETLQKCADKLEKLLHNVPPPSQPQNYSAKKTIRPFASTQKQSKNQLTFEKLLVMSEKKYSTKFTVIKRVQSSTLINEDDKENIGSTKKININLFSDTEQTTKKKNRESLGILHESYLKETNNFNFLTCEPENNVFLSPLSLSNEQNPSLSVFTKPRRKLELDVANVSYDHSRLTTLSHSTSQVGPRFEVLYKNEFVTEQLKTLLYNHNRHVIWNTIQTLNENLNLEVTRNITFESERSDRNRRVNQDDIANLQFFHVQTELQTLKLKAVAKDLSSKINKKKKQIYATISQKSISPDKMDSIERLFEEQLFDIGLDLVLVEMKKEINSAKKFEDSTDLQITLGKTEQLKEDITTKIGIIKHYVNNIYETLYSTISTREQTVACVRKLGPFVEDLSWSAPLTENLCSNETKTFEKFPLEYNRRCTYTDPRMFYKDIAHDIPTDIDLDSDSVYMLTTILESPFNPPETILLNILKSKIKLDALKSVQNHHADTTHKKYSLKELQAQESYVQYALDKLNSIMYSTASNKTLATADLVKKVAEIWVEMPFKDLISPNRTLEGRDYKFYEKQYNSFYNNI